MLQIISVTVVNMPACVNTVAYSCKTGTVTMGMRPFIVVKHPGNLLPTTMEKVSEYYVSRPCKIVKLVVPGAFF